MNTYQYQQNTIVFAIGMFTLIMIVMPYIEPWITQKLKDIVLWWKGRKFCKAVPFWAKRRG